MSESLYLAAPTCPTCPQNDDATPVGYSAGATSIVSPILATGHHGLFVITGAVIGWLIVANLSK